MGRIAKYKRIIVEDFPQDQQELISKLAFPINSYFEQLHNTVNGNVDFANIRSQVNEVTFTTSDTYESLNPLKNSVNTLESDVSTLESTTTTHESRLDSFYEAIVGSSSQVSSGIATHTNFQDAHDSVSAGGRIFVLDGSHSGNLSISKQVTVQGKGRVSELDGTLTMGSGADYCLIKHIKITGDITVSSGAVGGFFTECWQATGQSITDNSGGEVEINIYQE